MAVDGIVIRGHGKSFVVRSHGKDISCELRGKLKFKSDTATAVAVGDSVTILLNDDGTGTIERVEERSSMFFRPTKGLENRKQIIAANLDQLAVVASVQNPPLKPRFIDRFLIAAELGDMKPLVVINKLDLGHPKILAELEKGYADIGIRLLLVSAFTGEGFDSLRQALKDHKTILAGHSGVGKTAIINRLIPGLNLKEGAVSGYSDRGIHTTSLVELFELPTGGFIADTPGLKVLGLWEMEKADVALYFPEMNPYLEDCRFSGCSHTHEPDCAVINAVREGKIPKFRYDSYLSIRESL